MTIARPYDGMRYSFSAAVGDGACLVMPPLRSVVAKPSQALPSEAA